jgi:hypothetical protein
MAPSHGHGAQAVTGKNEEEEKEGKEEKEKKEKGGRKTRKETIKIPN